MPMPKARGRACEELKDQIGPLADWITARKAEGVPFLVLGDFNRWMDKGDTFWRAYFRPRRCHTHRRPKFSMLGQREFHRSYSCRRRGRDLDGTPTRSCPDLSGGRISRGRTGCPTIAPYRYGWPCRGEEGQGMPWDPQR